MDSDTASRFVSSLVKSIQALCNGYIDFSTSIEVVGHIHLRIDHNHKFNYVLSEEVSKSVNEGSTIFSSHSYHSLPPPSAPPTKLTPTSTGGPSSRRKSSHPLPRQEETDPMPVSLPSEVPSRSKELVSDRLSESGDSSHSLSMVVFPEIDELTGSGKQHSSTSGGRTRTISHTQDTLDRRRKSETHAPRSVDSPAKRSRDEESGSVQKTEFEVIEIKEEPGLDEPSCAFSESNQLSSHQGMGHTPDFSNCVMESLDRVGQIEGTSLLSASDGQQLHLASHQGQSDQPFPVMLHANPSVQAPGGVLTLPGPSNSQATASTTPGDEDGEKAVLVDPGNTFSSQAVTSHFGNWKYHYSQSTMSMAVDMVLQGVPLRRVAKYFHVPRTSLQRSVRRAQLQNKALEPVMITRVSQIQHSRQKLSRPIHAPKKFQMTVVPEREWAMSSSFETESADEVEFVSESTTSHSSEVSFGSKTSHKGSSGADVLLSLTTLAEESNSAKNEHNLAEGTKDG